MEAQIMTIPEGTTEEDMTPDQLGIILNCMAIEEEWIMDPIIRAEMSVIEWEDDDDEPTTN